MGFLTNKSLKTVGDVASWRLCMGCGACVSVCPQHNIRLINLPFEGLHPIVNSEKCIKCGACIGVCPGVGASHQPFNTETIPQLRQAWGPVLEVWEGYAGDPEIRFKGSSGGVATAISLFCLEEGLASAVLHVGAEPDAPLENATVLSKGREELIACTGSRYSPAAPCEKLNWVEQLESPCIFIGKPCDIVALRKAQANNAKLSQNVVLAVSIFCAGTPTTAGTHKLLKVLGVKPEDVEQIRYRGYGWPGKTIVKSSKNEHTYQMTYNESWGGILSKYVQMRCRLCPDGTGEFADISCGDPWYREIKPDESGRSLVLVRTQHGQKILRGAMEAGYIESEKAEPRALTASQKALLKRRQNLFGRLLAMHIVRIPAPHFKGFSLFSNWRGLSMSKKTRSVTGTLKRIFQRNWRKPLKVSERE